MEQLNLMWTKTKFNEDDEGERFVKCLINEGTYEEIVDIRNSNHVNDIHLPTYYDKDLFKRGQTFYQEYRNGLGLANFVGVVSVLAVESLLNIISCTNKSNTPTTAYKRYTETILYIENMYTDSPEDPNSLCRQTIRAIRRKHRHGSSAAEKKNLGFINQRDMVITQFSFAGYALLRRDIWGLPEEPDNLMALIHFWRVIGHMLGIHDKYNVFSGDLHKSLQRSEAVAKHIIAPALMHAPVKFDVMAFAALDGLRAIFPEVTVDGMIFMMKWLNNVPGYYLSEADRQLQLENVKKFPHYIGDEDRVKNLLQNMADHPEMCSLYKEKSFGQRFHLSIIANLLKFVHKWDATRILLNFLSFHRFQLLVKYPLIAMYRFGRENAYVDNSIQDEFYKRQKKLM